MAKTTLSILSAAFLLSSSMAAAGQATAGTRILQQQDDDGVAVCTEDFVFIDSLITHLGNPIGGCYENSTTLQGGYPLYTLGGGPTARGQARIYVSEATLTWEIGVAEEVNTTTGAIASLLTVCTSLGVPADEVQVTDPALNGMWQCTYFQDGVTNYMADDFSGVDCGCDGRTVFDPNADTGGGGGFGSTAIAITALVIIAALAVIVIGCWCFVRRRNTKQAALEAAMEDEDHAVSASAS